MFPLIVGIAVVLAFVAAVAVFHFADLRDRHGLDVLALAALAALAVFAVGAAIAWTVDPPRPSTSACAVWETPT